MELSLDALNTSLLYVPVLGAPPLWVLLSIGVSVPVAPSNAPLNGNIFVLYELADRTYVVPCIFGNPAAFTVPAVALPWMNLSARLGRLNVVEPLPEPYVVPITLNSAAYVSRLTAAPLHNNQPSGKALFPEKEATAPTSSPSDCADPFIQGGFPCVNEGLHGQGWGLYCCAVTVDGVRTGRREISTLKGG